MVLGRRLVAAVVIFGPVASSADAVHLDEFSIITHSWED
jgi:hypothetical protein